MIDPADGVNTESMAQTKTILCIRHGESTFNAAYRENPVDPLFFDAPLSPAGHRQVSETREALAAMPVQLVVTTPLTRALQTTAGIFKEHPSAPQVIVECMHRERLESSCDVGRAPQLIAADFPLYEFGHLGDIWWHAEGEADERGIHVEPIETLEERVETFRQWLAARQEAHIAVVGHGTFFFHLTGEFMRNCQVLPYRLPS